jgi:hypothetical protein
MSRRAAGKNLQSCLPLICSDTYMLIQAAALAAILVDFASCGRNDGCGLLG